MSTPVGAIVDALLERFPRSWAEPWDRVGLIAGDLRWSTDKVLVTLDLDAATIERARSGGFGLVLTHHPPFLEDATDLTRGRGGRATAWDALTSGIAVASFHTNLDRSPVGAEALPLALGLESISPLEESFLESDLVTVFVPEERVDSLRGAMTEAGAGNVGLYDGCAFMAPGDASFTPQASAVPAVDPAEGDSSVSETRLEMVCPHGSTDAVVRAAREAHPYEEPLIEVSAVHISRGVARLGRLCSGPKGGSLSALAKVVAERLGVSPRVWGDPDSAVATVACANGSASSLLGRAIEAGADALVCGEVRYHAAQEAAEAGLAIVEAGHDATEWPLVPVLAQAVRVATEEQRVEVVAAASDLRWWTWGAE